MPRVGPGAVRDTRVCQLGREGFLQDELRIVRADEGVVGVVLNHQHHLRFGRVHPRRHAHEEPIHQATIENLGGALVRDRRFVQDVEPHHALAAVGCPQEAEQAAGTLGDRLVRCQARPRVRERAVLEESAAISAVAPTGVLAGVGSGTAKDPVGNSELPGLVHLEHDEQALGRECRAIEVIFASPSGRPIVHQAPIREERRRVGLRAAPVLNQAHEVEPVGLQLGRDRRGIEGCGQLGVVTWTSTPWSTNWQPFEFDEALPHRGDRRDDGTAAACAGTAGARAPAGGATASGGGR